MRGLNPKAKKLKREWWREEGYVLRQGKPRSPEAIAREISESIAGMSPSPTDIELLKFWKQVIEEAARATK